MAEPYAEVSTNQANDIFAVLESFGPHNKQYAVLVSVIIAFAKIMGISRAQLVADIGANWARIPVPEIVKEH